jgi:hypothetical protein
MPATMTADYIAEAAQNLSLPELDVVLERLTTIRAHRRVPALSQTEADLLKRIETAVPLVALQRRKTLKAQRELTDEERSEFAQLTDEIETAEAGRIDLLSELAALRGVTLPEVARQLGLGRP